MRPLPQRRPRLSAGATFHGILGEGRGQRAHAEDALIALTGLAGRMTIKIDGGNHLYEFDYTLANPR
jgi:hypothetical protein